MQLNKKKELAARTLGVGKGRIIFNRERIDEIKEAITRQDIKDLVRGKAINIAEKTGTRTKVKRKTRRRMGGVRKKVNKRKREYITITRKLREFIRRLKEKKAINPEQYRKLRKEIKSRSLKSKAHLKERISGLIKETK